MMPLGSHMDFRSVMGGSPPNPPHCPPVTVTWSLGASLQRPRREGPCCSFKLAGTPGITVTTVFKCGILAQSQERWPPKTSPHSNARKL